MVAAVRKSVQNRPLPPISREKVNGPRRKVRATKRMLHRVRSPLLVSIMAGRPYEEVL